LYKNYFKDIKNGNLLVLRTCLVQIIDKWEQLESLISPWILLSVTANSIIIIAGACVLAIQTTITYTTFSLIISSAASIIRIIIYCHFGESITNRFKSLVKKVEVMSLSNTLSNDDWNQLNTIRNMNKQFTVDIFGLFRLRTTTTLAIGAFVLNYSVLLIQTDHNNNPCNSYKLRMNGTPELNSTGTQY
jgi:hypothetical protein